MMLAENPKSSPAARIAHPAPRAIRSQKGLAQRNLEIATMRSTGQTLAQVGARFDLTRERVRQVLDGPTPAKNTPKNVAIIERRRQDATCAEIAAEFGLSNPAVAHICRDVPRHEVWRARKSEVRKASMRREMRRAITAIERAWMLARGGELEADLEDLLGAACALTEEIKL